MARGRGRGRGRGTQGRAVGQAKKETSEASQAPEVAEPAGTAGSESQVTCLEPAAGEAKAADDQPSGLEAWECRLWAKGSTVVAGTDEAGRGPLAGPVVAAAFAVLAHEDQEVLDLMGKVNDSKQLSERQRDELFRELTDARFEGRTVWAIAESSAAEIDDMNILQASLSAMACAVRSLKVRPQHVLVDGCNRPPDLLAPGEKWTRSSKKDIEAERNQCKLARFFKAVPKAEKPSTVEEWRPTRVEAVIEGDGRVPSISAASVLAKVHRDRLMESLDERYPSYGFKAHKGYGTEGHMEAIRKHGLCPEHRRSFEPIRQHLEGDAEASAATPSPRPASEKRNAAGSLTALLSAPAAANKAGDKDGQFPAETPCKKPRVAESGKASTTKTARKEVKADG